MKIKTLLPSWRDISRFLELWLLAMALSFVYFSLIDKEPLFSAEYDWQSLLHDSFSMMLFIGLSLVMNSLFIRIFKPLQHYIGKLFLYSFVLLVINTIVATLYAAIDDIPSQDYTKSIYVFSLIATFISGIHANIQFQRVYRKQTEVQHRLELDNARQKEINLQTSLMVLKSQVDPHFLFNNFSILSDLIEESPTDAHDFLDALSHVYRYKLVNMNTDTVSIENELKMLHYYTELIQTRFGDAIQVTFPQHSKGKVPPLALQMLVENAIKHNAHSHKQPLKILIEIEEKNVIVSNARQPLSSDIESTGLGLANLRERYRLLANEHIQVIDQKNLFTVKIPIL